MNGFHTMRAAMMAVLALVLLSYGAAVAAQDYPALHSVDGVRSDDVLNVRAGPGVKHGIVGALEHDATGIEVIRVEGRWAMINADEGPGWASLKFLKPEPAGGLTEAASFRCSGTEPFWGLEIKPGQTAVLTTPESIVGDVFDIGPMRRMQSALEKHLLEGTNPSGAVAVVIQRAYCDDGMSEQEFGLDTSVVVSGANARVYAGCCHLEN